MLLVNLTGLMLTPSAQARSIEVQLQFPDKSIGLLHLVRQINAGTAIRVESNIFARARGVVTVPAGTHLKLHLNYYGCNPAALSCLGKFPADTIWFIDAGNLEEFGDSALLKVCETKGLRDLNLLNTQVSDAGLKGLSKLDRLVKLQLAETNITAASFPMLVTNRSLVGLCLRLTDLRNGDFSLFAKAKSLASLNIAATNIDSRAVSSLCKLQNLTELQLAGNGKINDADVKKLAVLKNLESLDLKDTGITAASIATFKTFPKLKILAVSYPPELVKRLNRELPKVSVTSTNSRPYPRELFSPLH